MKYEYCSLCGSFYYNRHFHGCSFFMSLGSAIWRSDVDTRFKELMIVDFYTVMRLDYLIEMRAADKMRIING